VSGRHAREGSACPLTFKVYGDGELLWLSDPVQKRADRRNFRLSVENVDLLELRVHCPASKTYAWAVWINPQLLK